MIHPENRAHTYTVSIKQMIHPENRAYTYTVSIKQMIHPENRMKIILTGKVCVYIYM